MKYFLRILITIIPLFSIAQKQGNIWYFGDHAGLDFNSGIPVPLTNGATYNSKGHSEGTSVICDSSGSLLFYTNGQQIWNRNHQVMLNGDNLLGHWSSTQAALIVPQPKSSRYFYVFTTDAFVDDNLQYGFRYSVVDMCLDYNDTTPTKNVNYGLGDVIQDKKNILLVDTVCEKVAVTRHANGIDYWVLTHKFFSNKFYAFLLTSNGITDTVISAIGSIHNGNIDHAIGQLKFSPNGQRVAIGASNGFDLLEIFDFDKSTGIISNCMPLYKPNNNSAGIYGVEFSPDNSKLYANGISDLGLQWIFLIQYDLSAGGGNLNAINASLNFIYKDTIGQMAIKGLQLGPDNKIYMVSANNDSTLSVIRNPDIYGSGCNYLDQSISLAGKRGSYTLPSLIAGYDYSNITYNCGSGIEEQKQNTEIIISQNSIAGTFKIVNSKNQTAKINVYNTLGEIIYETTINCEEKAINLNVPDGIYIIRVVCDEGTAVKKVIVQK